MTWLAKGGGVDQNVFLTIRDLREEQEIHLVVGSEIHHNSLSGLSGIKFMVCPHLVRPIHPVKDLLTFLFLYRLIRRERYDVVHTHEAKAGLLSRVAAWLAGCPRIVYGLHGVTFNDPMSAARRALYVWLERLTVSCADVVVSVSKSAIEEYRQAGIGSAIPWLVVYSGVDLTEFESKRVRTPERRRELRARLGVAEADALIVNVGRFSRSKAQRYTIEVFARLRARRQGLKLLLIGEGELLEDCRKLAQQLGVIRDTIFSGYSDNVPEMLSIADLQIFTSLREGLPRVVVESYLCGVPVAAFEVEGIHEIIQDGATGFVVPRGDLDALTNRAMELISEPGLRRRFAEQGYRHAAERWDHREMIKRLKTIYAGADNGR